jgi:hypothetical protein
VYSILKYCLKRKTIFKFLPPEVRKLKISLYGQVHIATALFTSFIKIFKLSFEDITLSFSVAEQSVEKSNSSRKTPDEYFQFIEGLSFILAKPLEGRHPMLKCERYWTFDVFCSEIPLEHRSNKIVIKHAIIE